LIFYVILAGVQEAVDKVLRGQYGQVNKTILDWLTPIDYGPQQSDFLKRRQPGTGQWRLDSAEYQTWLKTSQQTLFYSGILGGGKTIMTSTVVKDLRDRVRGGQIPKGNTQGGDTQDGDTQDGDTQDGDTQDSKTQNNGCIGIAYLYCKFRHQHEQSAEDLLANLLKQLAQGQSSLLDSVELLYDRHKTESTRASFEEISATLQSVAFTYSRVFIVVDALDECQATCRSSFVSEIFKFQTKTRANFLATSRPSMAIEKNFKGCLSLDFLPIDEDFGVYLDSHMSKLPDFVVDRPDLWEEIKTGITKAVGGIYLNHQTPTK
jgi:hypothetical protein